MGKKYRSGSLIRWVEAIRKMKFWKIPKDSEEGSTELGLRPPRKGCCPDGASGRWGWWSWFWAGERDQLRFRGENWSQAMLATRVKKAGRVSLFASHLPSCAPLWQSGQETSWQGSRAFVLQEPQPQHHSRQCVYWELRGQWPLSLTRHFSLRTVERGARCCPQRNSGGTRGFLVWKRENFGLRKWGRGGRRWGWT